MALVQYEALSATVSQITLNDPDNLNAMGEGMAAEFSALVQKLAQDPATSKLRAIIVTGAGRAFSAGGDLEMLRSKQQLSGEENRLRMHRFYNSFLGILKLNIPLIAAINGHAVGAGLCVACACDMRIASEKAKLGFTFVKLGLHPGMAATYFLPRVLGRAAASELLLTGRLVDAPEALRLGMVSRVVPAEQILSEARKLAEEVAANGPESVRQLVESLRQESPDLPSALEREALCQAVNYASKEFGEGVTAAIEKRAAQF